VVKIGTTQAQRKLFFNLRKEREKLEQLGFQPTTALLAEKLDVPEKEVVEMERRLAAPEASLDAPIGAGGDDDGSRTRLDYLPSDDIRPDRAVAQSEFSELLRGKLEKFASTLEAASRRVFRERWLTDEPLTLQEIGDRYQVSRERARQLEKRMLDRLKKYLSPSSAPRSTSASSAATEPGHRRRPGVVIERRDRHPVHRRHADRQPGGPVAARGARAARGRPDRRRGHPGGATC